METRFPEELIGPQGRRALKVQGPAFLTLDDSFYPGWTAHDRMSAEDLPIRPANVNFRTVYLAEARPYDVEFTYRQYWLAAALMMMAVSVAAWIGLAAATALKPSAKGEMALQSS